MIFRWLKRGALLTALAASVPWALRKLWGPPPPRSIAEQQPPVSKAEHKPTLKRWLLRIGAVVVVLGIGGFLVALSGIIPIKASSGHWAITRWFLNFAKERSVATHTLGINPPRLNDPLLIVKGAGHFETGCRPCHGSPSLPHPRIAWQMTPYPPYLPTEVGQWDDPELFYIVKHGIKFTGMPAWPALHRDDEVWAMVAFLRKFPELNAQQYQQLVQGQGALQKEAAPLEGLVPPENVPQAISASCARCHGADGLGRGIGAFPKLAGQKPVYLEESLLAYARGNRHSGIMQPIAAALSDDELRELARYYADLQPPNPRRTQPAVERGRLIAQQGIPSQRVPACVACHGPNPTRRNPIYPELRGQYAEYLVLQLEIFKKGVRGGTDYAHIMHQVAPQLTAEQMRDVALFYSSLGPPGSQMTDGLKAELQTDLP